MAARARVMRGVLVRRAVAAQRGAALLARAQMHPRCAHLHALRALAPPWALDVIHRGDVSAHSNACHDRYSFRTRCTNATAVDPSPTADATRFMLPERTSPTANTPGRLVSSKYGGRDSGQPADSRSSG